MTSADEGMKVPSIVPESGSRLSEPGVEHERDGRQVVDGVHVRGGILSARQWTIWHLLTYWIPVDAELYSALHRWHSRLGTLVEARECVEISACYIGDGERLLL